MTDLKWLLYDWGGLNVLIFNAINNVHGPWIDRFMLLGSRLGEYSNFQIYLLLLAIIVVTSLTRNRDQALASRWLLAILVFIISYELQGLLLGWLKPLLDFPRPPAILSSVHIIGIQHEYNHSLPSGHATFAMLVGASFWKIATRPMRFILAFFVIWVGMSRINLGMHFPADVVAGYLMSLAVVLLVRWSIVKLWSNNGQPLIPLLEK